MAKDDGNSPDDNDPKSLREKLERALEENKTLKTQVTESTQREQIREAGLSSLSKRQQRVILRELAEEEEDLNAENLKKIAKELGYSADEGKGDPPPDPNAGDNAGENGQGNDDPPPPPNRVEESLGGFDLTQQAERAARGGNVDKDLETKMRAAKSPEELTAIIRREGSKSGLVHSFDVD